MYKHFASDLTPDEIKTAYRTLCKQYHPDMHGGDTSVNWVSLMQEINKEYADATLDARKTSEPKRRSDSGRAAPTAKDYDDLAAADERIRAAIEKIITFHHLLDIEVCGLWVWVGGTHKRGYSVDNDQALNALMAAGYRWASKKEKWYYAGVPASHRGHWSMDKVRATYGSAHIKTDDSKSTTPAGRIS